MNTTDTQITRTEADWVRVLSDAEREITALLNEMPKDKLQHYVVDLDQWAKRVGEEAVARAFRILYAMGYSKSAVAITLGIGGPSLNRIVRDQSLGRRNSRSSVVPENPIDIRAEFEALS